MAILDCQRRNNKKGVREMKTLNQNPTGCLPIGKEEERISSGASRLPRKCDVPVWEKVLLTLEEASAYFGIGMAKIREMTDDENCKLVVWNGTKRLIKRRAMEKYLDNTYSI